MNKKGNISILVIFVLLASSLLGVLSMNFVQSMMKQSATVYNYYQSYYLAKAGVELGLAELGHRGIGFEQTFSDNNFVSNNFLCAGRCAIQFGLSGTSTNLSQQFRTDNDCQSPFVLSGGASLMVPVFQDTSHLSIADNFSSSITYTNLYPSLDNLDIIVKDGENNQVTFGLLILLGDELADNGVFFKEGGLSSSDLSTFVNDATSYLDDLGIKYTKPNLDERFFFMISNSSQQTVSFCLSAQEPIPTQEYYLKSQGTYDHQTLGLEAIYKQPIPDFLLNSYLNF